MSDHQKMFLIVYSYCIVCHFLASIDYLTDTLRIRLQRWYARDIQIQAYVWVNSARLGESLGNLGHCQLHEKVGWVLRMKMERVAAGVDDTVVAVVADVAFDDDDG